MNKRDTALHELVYEKSEEFTRADKTFSGKAREWQAVQQTGTRLWLDTADSGLATEVWDPAFEAFTTNNSQLRSEVERGGYDAFIAEAGRRIQEASPTMDERTFLREINLALSARHGLRLAKTFNKKVSVELHTDLANEVEASVAYGRRLYALCPEYFIVKVPYTPAGLLAARKLAQENIPVNLTLGFSARQACLAVRLANPGYVNVFLGRLNSYVEKNELGNGSGIGEKTARAAQRMVASLRSGEGADTQLIAASMRTARQVDDLAGIDVMTMPPAVVQAYRKEPAKEHAVHLDEEHDPRISLRPDLTPAEFNGSSLWRLEESEHCAVSNLMAREVDAFSPDDLTSHFANENVPDFMPVWTVEEIDLLLEQGKIPDHSVWGAQLRSGSMGLDVLMNMAALGAFVTDQKKLDDRIAQQL